MTVRIGILGYGNLGRGVELAVAKNDDMELAGIFTRRDPSTVKPQIEGTSVRSVSELEDGKADDISVLVICGGSATDLPEQTPHYAQWYNVIDSFDTHANIPDHYAAVNAAARNAGKTALISCGWDPGLFSLNRLFGNGSLFINVCFQAIGKGDVQIVGVADFGTAVNPFDLAAFFQYGQISTDAGGAGIQFFRQLCHGSIMRHLQNF